MGGRNFSNVVQAQEQCNAHLLPAVLLAGLAATAFFSASGTEADRTFAGQAFLIASAASACMEFAATYLLVMGLIYYATPQGEKYFRAFDSEITTACMLFQWGGWAFLASLPLRAIAVLGADAFASKVVSGCCVVTILGLAGKFLKLTMVFDEAYKLHLTDTGAPADFPISMIVAWFPLEEIQRKTPRVAAVGLLTSLLLMVPALAAVAPIVASYVT